MTRDAKIVQRGINVQANDLAVPAGTMTDSLNLAFDRDGVGYRRPGHALYADGLPANAYDVGYTGTFQDEQAPYLPQLGITRGVYTLFSGEVAVTLNQGLLFSQDGVSDYWQSIPFNTSHRYRYLGQFDYGNLPTTVHTLGRMLVFSNAQGPFNWQATSDPGAFGVQNVFLGTIGNDAANADGGSTPSVQDIKFRTVFDMALSVGGSPYYSDDTTIRNFVGGVLAGSITASGSADGAASSARFNGASWMTSDDTYLYVVDNTNEIRRVDGGSGTTTTFAGSTTAGDLDGVGTAARFRNISGITISNGFLYVAEGSGAYRIRRVDTTTASVTIYAGALTPTAGFTNGVGTAARFETLTGIEVVGSDLYVGDTGNNAIRKIVISSASVTTYLRTPSSGVTDQGFVPGTGVVSNFNGLSMGMPSPTVRGVYTSQSSDHLASTNYLCIECVAPNSSTDVLMLEVASTTVIPMHIARTPDSLPTATTGPMKLDTWGINSFRDQTVRGVDVVGGAVFTSMAQPRIIDAYDRLYENDPMPRQRQLGIPAPEAPSCTTTAGSTFASNSAWAYRTVCGLKLPNGRIALGPPSERVVVTTGSSVAGSVTAYPSPGLPYDGLPFVQIYRTRTTASSLTDPGDVMFLCNEQPLTYGQGVVITDLCSDDLLGQELYTNQYAFGAQSASLPPPAFANEVASFNQQVVLANFIPAASCRVKVLGTSPLVSATSTLTLTCTGPGDDACNTMTVFFNSAATNPSIKRAQIASGGSAAQNAVQTAKNIVRVINRCPDAFMFRAFYDESDPGSFVVYSQYPGITRTNVALTIDSNGDDIPTLNQSSVSFSTNASTAFATVALNVAQRQQNTMAVSDQSDPDSFPITGQYACGATNEAIQRCLPIAENILVVKDDNVFRSNSSYEFEIYETALTCTLPDSFARLNNQWIGLFTAGFRALTSSQAVAIGRSIDRQVTSWFAAGSYFGDDDFAAAAASDRQGLYLCAFNKQVFAFSAYGGGAWGTFEMPYANQPSWFGVHKDAFMPVISDYPNALFWQSDRRNSTLLASLGYKYLFYDAVVTMVAGATVTASTSLTATFSSTVSPLATAPTNYAGAIISAGSATAEIVSGTGAPFVLGSAVTIANGASITVYMPIPIKAQYAPSLAPGVNSQFGDVGVTLERASAGSLTCTFYNRKDALSLANSVIPYGQFGSANGIVRTNAMGDVDSAVDDAYSYYDFQRFATPAERSQDQTMSVALTNRQALAPLAIKAVVIELSEGGKVKQ